MKRVEGEAAATGRLDVAVKGLAELSNSKARRAIRTGKVSVGGERIMDPAFRVEAGARIKLEPAAPDPARTEPLGIRLVHRDDYVLVVNKPAGLNTTPSPGSDQPTALHAAQRLCKGPRRPKIVHRLDRDTSGLLVFARSVIAARELRAALDANEVRRMYRTVVDGTPEHPRGMISSMLMRDAGRGRRGSREGTFRVRPANLPDPGPMPGKGKLAITRYEAVARADGRTAMEVKLSTGRTHQIRIHLSELGCIVLGEHVYGRIGGARRLCLHAATLSFPHPSTGKPMSFEAPWPSDLADVTPRGRGW